MHWVKKVKYLREYLLEVTFNDGKIKTLDMKPYIGGNGVFSSLQDIEYFKRVKIDLTGNTICWENGADICPDVLYAIGKEKS